MSRSIYANGKYQSSCTRLNKLWHPRNTCSKNEEKRYPENVSYSVSEAA